MIVNEKMVIVKTKQWGNSLGLVIPSEIVKEMRLASGEDIRVSFERETFFLKDLKGFAVRNPLKIKSSAKEIVSEARNELNVD